MRAFKVTTSARPPAASTWTVRPPAPHERHGASATAASSVGASTEPMPPSGAVFNFRALPITPAGLLQRKATIAGPDEPLEREAEHVATRVLARLGSSTPTEPLAVSTAPGSSGIQRACDECQAEQEEEEPLAATVSSLPSGSVQRQVDAAEQEARQLAAAASAEPELEEFDEEQSEEEPVQARAEPARFDASEATAALVGENARIDAMSGGGRPLDVPIRHRMESAFGADFGRVRIHTGPDAAKVSHNLGALAFTRGQNIFFAQGRYQPQAHEGQRLLAHELTHVLQQGAATGAPVTARASQDAVQLQAEPDKKVGVGGIYLFDANGEQIYKSTLSAKQKAALGLPSGTHVVQLKKQGNGTYDIVGLNLFLTPGDPARFAQAHSRAAKVIIFFSSSQPGAPQKPGPLPETPPGVGASKPGEKEPGEKGPGEDASAPQGGKDEGTGTGTQPGKTGSKYGWLGVLELPQEIIDALEKAIELLGDSEEFLALRDLLQSITELSAHAAELGELFKDPEALLAVALGLKESAAIDALASWALADVPTPKPAKDPRRRGLAALAAKLVALLRKVRRVLRPVFKVREQMTAALGMVGLLLEAAPALEHLLVALRAEAPLAGAAFKTTAEALAEDVAKGIQQQLQGVRGALSKAVEKFSQDDLLTYEELSRGVVAAVLMLVPKAAKPFVTIAKEAGLDRLIADNVVAKLIPKATLDTANEAIRSMMAAAEPTAKDAQAYLDQILTELGTGVAEVLPSQLEPLFSRSEAGGAQPGPVDPREVASQVRTSASEPLSEDVRTDTESRLGFDFQRIRIHHDRAAATASEQLGANAFTVGSHVFFGAGRWAPHTPGGRQLLLHELVHTVQQGGGEGAPALQADYKDLLKRLSKRVSEAVLRELSGALAPSPAKRKKADEAKDKLDRSVIGRPFVSKKNPRLPEGYSYITVKGKVIIRRHIAWIRYLPALTIDKGGRIRLAALLSKFDPKSPARAQLRRALGCKSNQEAHHVVPLELRDHPVAKLAEANDWKFNGADNGLCLSEKVHSGSHPIYTEEMRIELDRLAKFGGDWEKIEGRLLKTVSDQKAKLSKRRKKLK